MKMLTLSICFDCYVDDAEPEKERNNKIKINTIK